MHLRLLVKCRGGGPPVHALGPLAGALRLFDRISPGPPQLHDLGAMHPAGACEGDHLGLLLAPLRQGRGPFAGAAERVHLLTGLDHAAIHQTRHEGRQLPRGDGDHDLVQQREPLLDLPLSNANPPLLVSGAGDQVRILAALADRGGVGRGRVCSLVVAGGKLLLHDRQQQVALLGALVLLLLQQPLRAPEPARRAADVAAKEETEAEPECAADRVQAFIGIQPRVMGALERPQILIVATDQVGRHGQKLEIVAAQRRRLVGAREGLIGIGPGPPPVVRTAPFDLADPIRNRRGRLASIELAHPLSSDRAESLTDPALHSAGFQPSTVMPRCGAISTKLTRPSELRQGSMARSWRWPKGRTAAMLRSSRSSPFSSDVGRDRCPWPTQPRSGLDPVSETSSEPTPVRDAIKA
jgi:hypothetical protein